MAAQVPIVHLPVVLRPDPARVVIRPFTPADDPSPASIVTTRAQRLADRVLALDEAALEAELSRVITSLSERLCAIGAVLRRRFDEISGSLIAARPVSAAQACLIGACFCQEYAFEAAALFNPSVVAHPDQSGLEPGALRFIMSLRGVGEGHVSSIAFRSGVFTAAGAVVMDAVSPEAVSPEITTVAGTGGPVVRLTFGASRDLSEIVISPITYAQRHGIEDLRLVRLVEDDGTARWLGTYTAYGGDEIRQEMLRTDDFASFELTTLGGAAAATKGMALFPRRIGGRYVMLGRLDHENIWLLESDDLVRWEAGTPILSPRAVWEFIQLGNCGSPIEIDEGWLVLIHGVGPVRNYCIGACLLDKADPARVLGRLASPLLRPGPLERYGYVPNVIYSCGGLVNGRTLLLPYGVADSFTAMATVSLDDLVAAMI